MINDIKYLNLNELSSAKTDIVSKIPPILHMIWVGDKEIPEYFIKNVNKWKLLMPKWHFMIWTNDHLTSAFIGNDYLNLIMSSSSGAQKADILRYYVIKKYGGFYVDADVYPLRSLTSLLSINNDIIICNDMPINFDYISNTMFASIPNHPVFDLICNGLFSANIKSDNIHIETGPGLFGKSMFNYEWQNKYPAVLHPSAFYQKTSKICIDFLNVSNRLYDIKNNINHSQETEETILLLKERFESLLQQIRNGHKSDEIFNVELSFGTHLYFHEW
jgi:mannosyltransferase OCH1-like enzyme